MRISDWSSDVCSSDLWVRRISKHQRRTRDMPTPMKPRTKNKSPDAPNTPFRGSLAQRACEFDQTPGCCCLAGLKLPFIFFRIFSKRSSAQEKSRLVRSEESRVGKEWVSPWKAWLWP